MAKVKAAGLEARLDRKALLAALEPAAAAVGRAESLPVLACVRVRAEGGRLVLTGTDLDLQVEAECSATVEAEGAVCCDAALLGAAVRAAGPDVTLALDGERLGVTGAECRSRLAVLPAEDFPAFGDPDGAAARAVWPGDLLQRALGRCRPAVSAEETRYYLNGVHLILPGQGGAVLEATDGHRLVRVRARLEDFAGQQSGIVPVRAVEAARKLPESVALTLWRGQARLGAGPVTLTTRLIDGSFPDTDRVIPAAQGRHRARLGRDELAAAVKRVAWAAGDGRARAVTVALRRGTVQLSARDSDAAAEAEAQLPAEVEGEIEIGLNARYLTDALGAVTGDRVTLSGENVAAPWRLDPDDDDGARIVVMPCRI